MGCLLLRWNRAAIDVTGLNFTSIALAVGGAVIVLVLFRAFATGRGRSV
jgi:uncharacterized membrane protein YeaQ/YmgE (transglycosylase-associated protein family)